MDPNDVKATVMTGVMAVGASLALMALLWGVVGFVLGLVLVIGTVVFLVGLDATGWVPVEIPARKRGDR